MYIRGQVNLAYHLKCTDTSCARRTSVNSEHVVSPYHAHVLYMYRVEINIPL